MTDSITPAAGWQPGPPRRILAWMAPKRSFLSWLLGKRRELGRLGRRDALLAKVVVDVHRHKTGSQMRMVPLRRLEPIHPIDRGDAMEDVARRAATLRARRAEIERLPLTKDRLLELMPSVSGLKAVDLGGERLLLFEGNGRLAALREVFGEESGLEVEVEVYTVDEPGKILRRLRRYWRHGGHPGATRVDPSRGPSGGPTDATLAS